MKTIMKKVRENKTTILKLLALLLILVIISLITLAVLFATNILDYDDGFKFNAELLGRFTGKWYGFLALMAIQIVLSILLCAIPGVAAAFVMLSTQILYPENPMLAFFFSYCCVIVGSTFLYILGRLGGYKICEKMLGKEDCEKSLELLRTRGTVYFPLMMLFPIFPDDALVMIAGTTRMKLSWFIPSIVVGRGVGAATIIFGMSIIPFSTFTSTFDWLILISITIFWLQQLFKIAHKIDRYFENKKNANAQSPVRINYLKIYFNVGAILISMLLPLIYLWKNFETYKWMILVTVCFLWIKDMLMAIADLIIYIRNKRDALEGIINNVMPSNNASVNTFHNIATFLICIGIAVLHFSIFNSTIGLLVLVSISFFWLRETFKLANKIDHYFAKMRITNETKLQGATEQTLEEAMNVE